VLRFAAGDARGQLEQLLGALFRVPQRRSRSGRDFEMSASIGYVLASHPPAKAATSCCAMPTWRLPRRDHRPRQSRAVRAAMHATAVKRFDLEADLRRAVVRAASSSCSISRSSTSRIPHARL